MKLFFKLFFGLIFLVVVGVAVFIMTFDLDRYRDTIMAKASEALGREVTIEKLELKMSLVPTLTAKGVTIFNPEGFDAKLPFAKIDSVDMTVSLLPLLKEQVQVNDFRLGVAAFNLIDTGTANNWTFVSPKSDSQPGGATSAKTVGLPQMNIDSIQMQLLGVSYEKAGVRQHVQLSDLILKQLKAVSFTLTYQGNDIKVAGTMNDLFDLLYHKPDYVFNMTVEALDATAKVSGKIGDTVNWSDMLLDFEVKTNNLSRSLSLLKIHHKLIPAQSLTLSGLIKGDLNKIQAEKLNLSLHHDALLIQLTGQATQLSSNPKINLTGDLNLTDVGLAAMYGIKPMQANLVVNTDNKAVAISQMSLTANKTDVQLNAVLSFADKVPNLTAQLASTYFNPKDIFYEDETGTQKSQSVEKTQKLFSDKPIDFSALKSMNANIGLKMKHLEIAPDRFKGYLGVVAQAVLHDGMLTLNPLKIDGLDGRIQGAAQIDASGEVPYIRATLNGDNMALDNVKSLTKTIKGSVLNAQMNVTASGQSSLALVSTLNGSVVLEVSEGKIVNEWFNTLPMAVGLIQMKKSFSFSKTDQESRLNCAALNLNIKDGMIHMDKSVALETSLLNFSVSGTVNLPQETLSVSMVPSISQLNAGVNRKLSLTQIVKIEGPFNDLQVHLDAKDVLKNAAQTGLEKLAGKLIEKAGGTETESAVETPAEEPTNLCEIALGRKPKGKVETVVARPVVKAPEKKEAPVAPETFKEELMKSLSEAIKK